ncbi:MAG TPA: MerR family transcriptional regulator, partial [Chloroflexota bacterium]
MPTDNSDTPLYNIAAVAQRTGVPATTIRAWERRYDYPMPHRDEAGQRLYSERDVETVRWLLDQTQHGVAISRAVDMLRSGHARTDSSAAQAPPRGGRSFAALRAELGQALLTLDAGRADVILAEAFALYSVEDVCLQVLQPLLVDVGDRWHAGELSV